MSFNRIKYDKTEYDDQINESIKQSSYRIFGLYAENNKQCYPDNSIIAQRNGSSIREYNDLSFSSLADVESLLTNRDKIKGNISEIKTNDKKDCSEIIYRSDSRFTHPIVKYRGMSNTLYNYSPFLFSDPQKHIQTINFKGGLNTRNYSKDNHVVKEQKFIDIGGALPSYHNPR